MNIEMLEKLYELINSQENLWLVVAKEVGSLDYFLREQSNERFLAVLNVIKGEIGDNEDIRHLTALATSSSVQVTQPAASRSEA